MATRSPRRFPYRDGPRASINIIVDDLLNDLLETVLTNLRDGLLAGSAQATTLSKRETSGTPRQRAAPVASGRVTWSRDRATFSVLVPGVSQWSATFVYRVRRNRANAVKRITFWAWPEVDSQPQRVPGIEFCIFPGAWLDLAKLTDPGLAMRCSIRRSATTASSIWPCHKLERSEQGRHVAAQDLTQVAVG